MPTLKQIINIVNPTWAYPFEDDQDLFEEIGVEKLSYSPTALVADGIEIVCERPRLMFARVLALYPYVNAKVTKGENVICHSTALIGGSGFGYVRDEQNELVNIKHFGGVEIHDNVTIGEYVNIHRGVIKNTIIGAGTKIDFGCHIAHSVVLGKNNSLAAHCIIEGSCVVGDNNTFGTNVVVQRKVKIGNGCKFGSGAVITKDIPDGETWVGNPAKCIKKTLTEVTTKDSAKQYETISNAKEVPMSIIDFGANDDLGA